MPRCFLPLLCVLLLVGCATSKPRFETAGVNLGMTPQAAASEGDKARAQEVLWGGVIVAGSNLADATQLEILAYPLDDRQRPDTARRPLGRFLAVAAGYLETADYAQGRLITIRGTVRETVIGRIGEASYTYPVVDIADRQLWQPEAFSRGVQPRVNFGFGVMIGR